jgi:hypothetical protein
MIQLAAGNCRGAIRGTESGKVSYGSIGGGEADGLAISLGLVLSGDRAKSAGRVLSAGLPF